MFVKRTVRYCSQESGEVDGNQYAISTDAAHGNQSAQLVEYVILDTSTDDRLPPTDIAE